MKRFFVEEAKCGVTGGGIACGPVSGSVVASIKFIDGAESKWLSLVDVTGIPNLYLTDRDIFDDLIEEDFDEEFEEYSNKHFITEYEGIALASDYSDIFKSIRENLDNPAVPLIRYLIALVDCAEFEEDELISLATGKYIDEVNVPISAQEEDFEEEDF